MVAQRWLTLVVLGCARGAQGSLFDSLICVVDSWRWALSCGVVFSGGPCLLDRGGLSSLRAVERRRSSCWEFHVTT